MKSGIVQLVIRGYQLFGKPGSTSGRTDVFSICGVFGPLTTLGNQSWCLVD